MAIPDVHKNDLGTRFQITVTEAGVAVDISSATLIQLIFRKPDGTIITKTAVFVNTGTDGKMEYVTQAAFLVDPGRWSLQGAVTFSASQSWRTLAIDFLVLDILA